MITLKFEQRNFTTEKCFITRIDVYETLCLYIKVAKLRTGVGSAEMGGIQVGGDRVDVNEELKFL